MTTGRINQISTRNLFSFFRIGIDRKAEVPWEVKVGAMHAGMGILRSTLHQMLILPRHQPWPCPLFTVFPIVCPVWLGLFQYRFSRVYLCRLCRGDPRLVDDSLSSVRRPFPG